MPFLDNLKSHTVALDLALVHHLLKIRRGEGSLEGEILSFLRRTQYCVERHAVLPTGLLLGPLQFYFFRRGTLVGVTKDEGDEDATVLLLPVPGWKGERIDLGCQLDNKCSFHYDQTLDRLICLELRRSRTLLTVIPLGDASSSPESTASDCSDLITVIPAWRSIIGGIDHGSVTGSYRPAFCYAKSAVFVATLSHTLQLYHIDLEDRSPLQEAQCIWRLDPTKGRSLSHVLGVTASDYSPNRVRVWVASKGGDIEAYTIAMTGNNRARLLEPAAVRNAFDTMDPDDLGTRKFINGMWQLGSDLFCFSTKYSDEPRPTLALYDGNLKCVEYMGQYETDDRVVGVVPGNGVDFHVLIHKNLSRHMDYLRSSISRGSFNRDLLARPHIHSVWTVEWGVGY